MGALCYDFTDIETYMNLPDVLDAIGVPAGTYWTECDNLVHSYLTQDWMTNLEIHIPDVLAAGVRVMVYGACVARTISCAHNLTPFLC